MLGNMTVRRIRDFWYGLNGNMHIEWSEKVRCVASLIRRIAYNLYINE